MFDFEQYMMSQGEGSGQWLLEQIEQLEGVDPNTELSLEERWAVLQIDAPLRQQSAN